MPIHRRKASRLALGLPLGAWLGEARAQAVWPDRPVRMVVGFGAGGAIDTISRTVANAFPGQAGGQTLVVENRPGAGGAIAAAAVARAKPDGTTLMMADIGGNGIAGELMRGLSYDPVAAFAPVCHLVNLPLVVLVPAGSPARTLPELIELARKQPGMPYGNPGNGYVGHLAQELILKRSGVTMTPVVYRSGAEVVRSLLANETGSSVITVSTSLPFLREGRLRALAVCGAEPVALLPGVPTVAETLPGFEANVWHGVVAPAGLPPEILAAANRVFNDILTLPEVRRAVEEGQAGRTVGGTPAAFGRFIAAEVERWTPVIREAGIRIE